MPDSDDLDHVRGKDHYCHVLRHVEARAIEPYRTLHREAGEALERDDWQEARRIITKVWTSTEGMDSCERLNSFHPELVSAILWLHNQDSDRDSAGPLRFLEEVLTVTGQARALPVDGKLDPEIREDMFAYNLYFRTLMADFYLRKAQPREPERAASILEPARKEIVDKAENIRRQWRDSKPYHISQFEGSVMANACECELYMSPPKQVLGCCELLLPMRML